jgi:hypothetical protein
MMLAFSPLAIHDYFFHAASHFRQAMADITAAFTLSAVFADMSSSFSRFRRYASFLRYCLFIRRFAWHVLRHFDIAFTLIFLRIAGCHFVEPFSHYLRRHHAYAFAAIFFADDTFAIGFRRFAAFLLSAAAFDIDIFAFRHFR